MDNEYCSSPWDKPEFQQRRHIDLICRKFEDGWRQGFAVSIEACVEEAAPELRSLLLTELIAVEWELLQEAGESPSPERYRERFPQQETILNQLALGSRFRSADDWDAASDHSSPLTLQSGDVFAGYRILHQIGAGGMGTVFLAEIPAISHPVALKILEPAGRKSGQVAARFEQEARLLSRLDHPGIVPLYAYGFHEGFQYLVMKAIPGISLSSVLASHEHTSSEPDSVVPDEQMSEIIRIISNRSTADRDHLLLDFAVQIAEALQAVHAGGILHRDIKPSNILVTSARRVFLTDFGLARHADSDNRLTLGGEFVGTPRYSAPETLDGQYSPQSDLYSLGLVLFELFSLQTPFQCESRRELLRQKLSGTVPEMVGTHWARRDIQRLISRLTDSAASSRLQSAEELIVELQACQTASSHRSGQPQWTFRRTVAACLLPLTITVAAMMLVRMFPSAATSAQSSSSPGQIARSVEQKVQPAETSSPFESLSYAGTRWLQPVQHSTLPLRQRIIMLDVSRDGRRYLAVTEKGAIAIQDGRKAEPHITTGNTIRIIQWVELTDKGNMGLIAVRDPLPPLASPRTVIEDCFVETWSPNDEGWIRLGEPSVTLPRAKPYFTHGLPEEMTPFVLIPNVRTPTLWHPLTRGFAELEFALDDAAVAVAVYCFTTAAVSTDGKVTLVFNAPEDGRNEKYRKSVETGLKECRGIRFSPDMQWIVLAGEMQIALISTADWTVTTLPHDLAGDYEFAFSSNSRFLALGQPYRGILADLENRRWAGELHTVNPMLLLSPRSCGPALIAVEESGRIMETWFSNGIPPRRREVYGTSITAAGFCDAGSCLAISTEPGNILVLKMDEPDNPFDKRTLNRDFLQVQLPAR